MAVNLNDQIVTIPERKKGTTDTLTFTVPAGKTLKIATSPSGEEIAAGTVPVGKQWAVRVVVSITES